MDLLSNKITEWNFSTASVWDIFLLVHQKKDIARSCLILALVDLNLMIFQPLLSNRGRISFQFEKFPIGTKYSSGSMWMSANDCHHEAKQNQSKHLPMNAIHSVWSPKRFLQEFSAAYCDDLSPGFL